MGNSGLAATMFGRQTQPDQPDGGGWLGNSFLRLAQAGNSQYVTEETALNSSAVYAAVNLISDSMKTLPLHVFERLADGGKQIAEGHKVDALLHMAPNPEINPGAFKKLLQSWRALWGNGYAEIAEGRTNGNKSLWPIHPSRVQLKRDDQNRLYYEVWNEGAGPSYILPEKMFHIRGFSLDGFTGLSVVARFARESIGVALATERYGFQFYGNNAQPGIALVHPGVMDEPAQERLRSSWSAAYGAGGERFGVAVLEQGTEPKILGMPHSDAQFLETRVFQIDEIARWFKIPPHMLAEMSHSTFSNIEHQGIEYVTNTILPETIEWEEEADRKLLLSDPKYYVKFNVDALQRGDSKARSDFYKAQITSGVMTINEARALENLNPIGEAGDVNYVMVNMTNAETMLEPDEPEPSPSIFPEPELEDNATPGLADAAVRTGMIRLARKAAKMTKQAVRKHIERASDVDAFTAWARVWSVGHAEELIADVGPMLELQIVVTHSDAAEDARAGAEKHCHDCATARLRQLFGVVRDVPFDDLASALIAKAGEWEIDYETE